jgi:hypothetical protein
LGDGNQEADDPLKAGIDLKDDPFFMGHKDPRLKNAGMIRI